MAVNPTMVDEYFLDELEERIQILDIQIQEFEDSITEFKHLLSIQHITSLEKQISFKKRQWMALNNIFEQEWQWFYELEKSFNGTRLTIIANILGGLEESVQRLQQSLFNSEKHTQTEELRMEILVPQSIQVCDAEKNMLSAVCPVAELKIVNVSSPVLIKILKDKQTIQLNSSTSFKTEGSASVYINEKPKIAYTMEGILFCRGEIVDPSFMLLIFYDEIVDLGSKTYDFYMLKEKEYEIRRRQRMRYGFMPKPIHASKVFVKIPQTSIIVDILSLVDGTVSVEDELCCTECKFNLCYVTMNEYGTILRSSCKKDLLYWYHDYLLCELRPAYEGVKRNLYLNVALLFFYNGAAEFPIETDDGYVKQMLQQVKLLILIELKKGVVAAFATDSRICFEIGASMLREGGCAVDIEMVTSSCAVVGHLMTSVIEGGAFINCAGVGRLTGKIYFNLPKVFSRWLYHCPLFSSKWTLGLSQVLHILASYGILGAAKGNF